MSVSRVIDRLGRPAASALLLSAGLAVAAASAFAAKPANPGKPVVLEGELDVLVEDIIHLNLFEFRTRIISCPTSLSLTISKEFTFDISASLLISLSNPAESLAFTFTCAGQSLFK